MATRQFLYPKTTTPTVNDDTTQGYKVGDEWLDTTNLKFYKVLSVTAGAAVWKEFSITSSLSDIQAGWVSSGATWSYSSVDSPNGVFSIAADMTAILKKGMRVKYNQSQALSAYWSFDVDNSAGVGSFTMANVATPTYTAGKFSNALTLNGTTQALQVTDVSTLKPTGEFTLGVWIKTSTTGTNKSIFQSYSANTNIAGINMRVDTNNVINVTIGKNTGTTQDTDYMTILSTSTVTDGVFHYVVLSFRNNIAQLYIDGVLESTGYCVTPAYAATNYIRIGCQSNSGTDISFFNGQIDDLYFINGYALDEKTIYDKYIAATAQGTSNITVTKMAIIVNVGAYSGGVTLVTAFHGTDYTLANATISSPYYSNMKAPFGFPVRPDKWKVLLHNVVDNTQSTPGAGTIYNIGSFSVSAPIGSWVVNVSVDVLETITVAAVTNVIVTAALSPSSSAMSDLKLKGQVRHVLPIVTGGIFGGTIVFNGTLNLVAKTTYYLLESASVAGTTLGAYGSVTATKIELVSGYL